MAKYSDLADLPEDERIAIIAEHVRAGNTVGVITDSDPGKADRYLDKLRALVPDLCVIDRFDGPVAGSTTLKVARLRFCTRCGYQCAPPVCTKCGEPTDRRAT